MKKTVFTSRSIATMAILTALSYILYMFVKFPLPFLFPAFLDIQFSDAPIILGSYMLGIPCGVIMAVARFLLKLPFSSTAMVGEIADLLITIAFILPSTYAYRKSQGKKIWISLFLGSVSSVAMAMIANQFLLIPFFVKFFFGGDFGVLIAMVSPLYPTASEENFFFFYQLFAVLPFNILRLFVCGSAVFAIERKLKTAF